MTLQAVPRYDPGQVGRVGDHAVVVGAGMAGLFAARVLADGFERVTLVERDPLPDEPVSREGVPQAHHAHALLEAGRATMEDLFPGYGEDLLSGGGLLIDGSRDVKFYDEGDFLADGPKRIPQYLASRPLFEFVARRHLAGFEGVTFRPGCRLVDYVFDKDTETIRGVVVRDGDAGEERVPGDLVVDATGRASRTPNWLADNGYAGPRVADVGIDVLYRTVVVRRPPDDRRGIFAPASYPRTRGGVALPIEGDRWLVNVHGMHGDHPPADFEGFVDFAGTLPIADLRQILDRYQIESTAIESYPFPSNRRRYYETLDDVPTGLVVIGDAIASFNPIYGQGMSVAALEALLLHHALASGDRAELGARFFEAVAPVVDIAWTMAVGADLQFSETSGPEPFGADLFARYLSRLTRKAHTDGRLRDALYRVIMMEEPPTALLRPGVIFRVLRPTITGSDSATPSGAEETSPLRG